MKDNKNYTNHSIKQIIIICILLCLRIAFGTKSFLDYTIQYIHVVYIHDICLIRFLLMCQFYPTRSRPQIKLNFMILVPFSLIICNLLFYKICFRNHVIIMLKVSMLILFGWFYTCHCWSLLRPLQLACNSEWAKARVGDRT